MRHETMTCDICGSDAFESCDPCGAELCASCYSAHSPEHFECPVTKKRTRVEDLSAKARKAIGELAAAVQYCEVLPSETRDAFGGRITTCLRMLELDADEVLEELGRLSGDAAQVHDATNGRR